MFWFYHIFFHRSPLKNHVKFALFCLELRLQVNLGMSLIFGRPHRKLTCVYSQPALQTLGCVLTSDSDGYALSSGLLSQSRPSERKPQGLQAHRQHYAEIAVWHPDTWCRWEEQRESEWQEPPSSTAVWLSELIVWNQPTWQEREQILPCELLLKQKEKNKL